MSDRFAAQAGRVAANRILLDKIVNTATPIFASSAVSALSVLINIGVVGARDPDALYLLGLFLPIYYVLTAIQEGLRIPILRYSGMAREDGAAAELGRRLGFLLLVMAVVIVAVAGVFALGFDAFAGLFHVPEHRQSQAFRFIAGMLGASILIGCSTIMLSALFGLGRSALAGGLGIGATVLNLATAHVCANWLDQGIYSLVWAALAGSGPLALVAVGVLAARGVVPSLAGSWERIGTRMAEIAALGLPVTVSFLVLFCFLFAFNFLVSFFGESEVSGFGIAFRLQSFVILPGVALGTAAAILINGAVAEHQFALARRYFLNGIALSVVLYVVVAAAVFLLQDQLLHLFTSDPNAIAAGRRYLGIVGPSYASIGPVLVLLTLYEQTGYGLRALTVNIVGFSLEIGFAGWFGLGQPDAAVMYLVIAAMNWLALLYLIYEVARRMKGRPGPRADATAGSA